MKGGRRRQATGRSGEPAARDGAMIGAMRPSAEASPPSDVADAHGDRVANDTSGATGQPADRPWLRQDWAPNDGANVACEMGTRADKSAASASKAASSPGRPESGGASYLQDPLGQADGSRGAADLLGGPGPFNAHAHGDERSRAPLEEEFLTVDELAELLRLNRKTVYEAIDRGEIPGVRRIGESYRIHRATVLKWFASSQGRVSHSRRHR